MRVQASALQCRTLAAPKDAEESSHTWFIPHHMVHHNEKDRIVFNCPFTFNAQNLNDQLLPGPTLGTSLLGVLLRFREHPITIGSNIKGMFHQVRLLEEDKPFLRFLWRDMEVHTVSLASLCRYDVSPQAEENPSSSYRIKAPILREEAGNCTKP
ncbi:hypothetical protein F2P81_003893 [Scophthalmus maximus]|uniref:Uncharacterized protein n=1 Tax=Scophthalmus maximus TaxID=52904 RepID=A0A6A4THL3_SCOMX|nr:hypothetical protein F2P81_003893 [Scophthalmus maximus]